jgi:hypothetical protein
LEERMNVSLRLEEPWVRIQQRPLPGLDVIPYSL